jgi:putative ABC transport system permease protein
MTYLAGLSDEQLHEAASAVAAKTAKQLYAANASTESPEAYAKAAAAFDAHWQTMDGDEAAMAALYDAWMPSTVSGSTLSEVLETLGAVNAEKPTAIHIYAQNFEDKDAISALINEYNESVENEDDQISYTDYMAMMMSGITNIINAISYGLIAFVAVSLVVSSIMIGIITYISVLERIKEIGILRAIGASKRDVSLVFNAETLIVGFTAGMIGIGSSLLLCLPINWIVHALIGITAINAFLPGNACVILVIISMVLTFVAGLFPASMAARKDPVEALRTE